MIDTHFTRAFGLLHPVALDPFCEGSDGPAAARLSQKGGLGLAWAGADLAAQHQATGVEAVGWGCAVSQLDQDPELLDRILARRPRAIALIGTGQAVFGARVRDAGCRLLSVVDSVAATQEAIEIEAEAIIVRPQQTESVLGLLPQVADTIYAAHAETLLLVSGGITDARAMAACLIMGADGVLIGPDFREDLGLLTYKASRLLTHIRRKVVE